LQDNRFEAPKGVRKGQYSIRINDQWRICFERRESAPVPKTWRLLITIRRMPWHGLRRAITGDTALRLAHFFGTSAEFWLNVQSLYAIRLAEQRSGKSIRALPRLKSFEQVRA
jgi:hypothetical protein